MLIVIFELEEDKENGQWLYSVADCVEVFRAELPDFAIECLKQITQIQKYVGWFEVNGNVLRKNTTKRTAENIENVEIMIEGNVDKSIRRLAQVTNLSYNTCRLIKEKLPRDC